MWFHGQPPAAPKVLAMSVLRLGICLQEACRQRVQHLQMLNLQAAGQVIAAETDRTLASSGAAAGDVVVEPGWCRLWETFAGMIIPARIFEELEEPNSRPLLGAAPYLHHAFLLPAFALGWEMEVLQDGVYAALLVKARPPDLRLKTYVCGKSHWGLDALWFAE
mmetsp:Transcript_13122/g.22759  ORF Transcript_13122/g.22759 Transcript_13122/m.22759 type:complete len:164 (+) Transcript_13122:17-508(+)